jgi:hypothetical protein
MMQAAPVSKKALWAGRILSVLPALVFLFSGIMKFVPSEQLTEGFAHLEWHIQFAMLLGMLELSCTILYLIPQTAVLGAILLTGYLGGAIATHVRIGDPIYMHIVLGVVLWLGLFLRDRRVRALIPVRQLADG